MTMVCALSSLFSRQLPSPMHSPHQTDDMWTKSEENESPPEWVESERESFKESRDKVSPL